MYRRRLWSPPDQSSLFSSPSGARQSSLVSKNRLHVHFRTVSLIHTHTEVLSWRLPFVYLEGETPRDRDRAKDDVDADDDWLCGDMRKRASATR
jgi:hypothetical protein